MILGEMALPLATCSRWESCPSNPQVLIMGDLSLSLISCNTQENRLTSHLGSKYIRANSGSMGTSELVPKGVRVGELALPLTGHVMMWARERCPPLLSPLAIYSSRKPLGHQSWSTDTVSAVQWQRSPSLPFTFVTRVAVEEIISKTQF